MKRIIFLIIQISGILLAESSSGVLTGRVVNSGTREPIPGVTVILKGAGQGTASDADGIFWIPNILPGAYVAEFRMVGFETLSRTDIAIRPGKETMLEIVLTESVVETKEVVVKAGYFQNDELSPLGLSNFNDQEIRRAPGSAGDISRFLMSMPSVAKVADNSNDLAVRGGSPAENGFYIDNIPVPNINHFAGEGSTGGPIGLINVDFIDNVNFYTSGFSSSYGDRLSSVVNIKFREGSRSNFTGKTFLGFGGAGIVAEGPIGSGNASFLFSAQKSYLDIIVDAIGTGSVPKYGDAQLKTVWDINKNHHLTFLEIFGSSVISFSQSTAVDKGSSHFGTNKTTQATTGTNWLAIWSSSFYSNTSLSASIQYFDNDFYNVFSGLRYLRQKNLETYVVFRNINYLQIDKVNKLEFGAEFKYNNGNFDYYHGSDTNRLGGIQPALNINQSISPNIAGGFISYIARPFENIIVCTGLRADHYYSNKKTIISPRASITYKPFEILSFSVNGGIFYQSLPMLLLAQSTKASGLENPVSYNLGAGMEYMLSDETKLTVEIYQKEYEKLPLTPSDPTLSVIDGAMTFTRFTGLNDFVSKGKAYTRGIELMIQKRMAEDFYGLISGSYYRSRYQDLNGTWRNRIYDNKFIFSAIGGYKPNEKWEFSIRWTYAGGTPYTPFDLHASEAARNGIIDINRINDARMPDYHSLNLRVDRKFYFEHSSLDFYVSTMNTYNRQNVNGYNWNVVKNKQETEYQWSLIPIIGMEYEF